MRIVLALAGVAAVVGVAPPAHADPGADASFLAALDKAGITYHSGPVAVEVGKRACELMDQGHPEIDVIKEVSSSNPGFTVDGAAKFTMIAASAFCPQHLGQQVSQAPPPPQNAANRPDAAPPVPPAG